MNSTDNIQGRAVQNELNGTIQDATPDQVEAAAEQLDGTETKFIFQLIAKASGARSDPFTATWPQLLDVFDTTEEAIISSKDYVLLVAVLEGENTRIPNTPLISVEDLIATNDRVRQTPKTQEEDQING